MIKQSFSWWSNAQDADPQTLLKAAKQIGYSGVEMIPEELIPIAADSGLEIATMTGHDSIELGLNDPLQHNRIEDEIAARLEFAKKNQIANLIVFSGSRRNGLTEEAGAEYMVAGLKRVAPMAEKAGVSLIIELLNSKIDHEGYQCDHTLWGVGVVKAVASERVKLLYDIYHMQIMEGDLIRTITSSIGSIAHFHTAGNPGRHDPDDDQEIAYPAVIRAIAKTGYSGYIGHEFLPKGDPIDALRKAFELTERALV